MRRVFPFASPPCSVPRGPAAPGAGSFSGDAVRSGAGSGHGRDSRSRLARGRGPLGAGVRAALPGTRRRSPHAPRPGRAGRAPGGRCCREGRARPWGSGEGGPALASVLQGGWWKSSVKCLNTRFISDQVAIQNVTISSNELKNLLSKLKGSI